MFLYHFTDKADLTKIDPSFFGVNHYSRNEAQASGVKRAFFYDSKEPKEALLSGSNFRYGIELSNSVIYDLDKDKQRLKDKFNFDVDAILRHLSKHFLGVSYTTSFKCYAIFKAVKVTRQEKRGILTYGQG